MNHVIEGTVWRCGDGITTYQIIPQKRWMLGAVDAEELGKWAFEGVWDELRDQPYAFRDRGYEIVVAGHNFGGGGKSIEHPVAAMQGAGVRLTLAESISRYNFRNSINRGLPAIACPGIGALFATGDRLRADLLVGEIRNLTTGAQAAFEPFPDLILRFLGAGGMLRYYDEND